MNPNNERNQVGIKSSDVFAIPLTKVNWYFVLWMIAVILTMLPGTLLCIITLGGFRYYHLMGKLCSYLVDKQLAKELNGY